MVSSTALIFYRNIFLQSLQKKTKIICIYIFLAIPIAFSYPVYIFAWLRFTIKLPALVSTHTNLFWDLVNPWVVINSFWLFYSWRWGVLIDFAFVFYFLLFFFFLFSLFDLVLIWVLLIDQWDHLFFVWLILLFGVDRLEIYMTFVFQEILYFFKGWFVFEQ